MLLRDDKKEEVVPSKNKTYPYYKCLDLAKCEMDFDIKKETISTIISYLSLFENTPVKTLSCKFVLFFVLFFFLLFLFCFVLFFL
jgi:hypothetical protein